MATDWKHTHPEIWDACNLIILHKEIQPWSIDHDMAKRFIECSTIRKDSTVDGTELCSLSVIGDEISSRERLVFLPHVKIADSTPNRAALDSVLDWHTPCYLTEKLFIAFVDRRHQIVERDSSDRAVNFHEYTVGPEHCLDLCSCC